MIFGYPISGQQLLVLNFLGVHGEIWLWLLRLTSLLILVLALIIWFNILSGLYKADIAKISVIIIFFSPLFLVLALVYPLVCLKLLLFVVLLWFGVKNKYYFGVLAIALILFNIKVLGGNPAIFNKIDLKDAQIEVTRRISSEDSLKESIELPLWWRRVSYNKVFFAYKQIVAEILPFFDLESIFFQEINPLAQKSIVIFYWPEVLLFILGIYFVYNLKNMALANFLGTMFGLSLVDFVFSEGAPFLRLVLVIFPLSVVVGFGIKKLPRLWFGASLVLILFAIINSFYDLNRRTDYWLDNRPMAFEFWYKEIGKLNLDQFDKIQVTGLIGPAKEYCYFYLGKVCDEYKFVFDNFDLTMEKTIKTVYAGFGGEFVGPSFTNDIDVNWSRNFMFDIVAKKTLRDTVAYKYGNDIGVGVVR